MKMKKKQKSLEKPKYETRTTWELVTGWKECGSFYTRVKPYAKPRTSGAKLNGSNIY